MNDNVTTFDFLNDINFRKEYIFTEETEKVYTPYFVNRFLSGTMDTLLLAQQMNERMFLDKKLQYDYLFHSVKKSKRFTKWLKNERSEDLTLIQKLFCYNKKKAREVLSILSEDQLQQLRDSQYQGGKTK